MEVVRIRTDQVETGMTIASDVYTNDSKLILTKGTKVDERIISGLQHYDIRGVVIYREGDIPEQEESYIDMIRNTTEFKKFNRNYVETVGSVESSFHNIIENETGEVNIGALLSETDRILKEGRNGAHIFEMLHGVREYDDLTFVHSLNVSLICNIFGHWLKFPEEEIRILTLAGLFHDIGKVMIPREVLQKPGKLTSEEFELVRQHSLLGYQAIKDSPIDIRIKYAALMHHERCDGSGYPNGFKGNQIESLAKIVAIADVYDAMTSNRIYRKGICPFEVVEVFEKEGFLLYDPAYLMVFLERIVGSYVRTLVRLTDGRVGEVVMINKLALSRPVIRIGKDFVDLSKESKLKVESII